MVCFRDASSILAISITGSPGTPRTTPASRLPGAGVFPRGQPRPAVHRAFTSPRRGAYHGASERGREAMDANRQGRDLRSGVDPVEEALGTPGQVVEFTSSEPGP